MNSTSATETRIVQNVKSRANSQSGFFVALLLFLGGCLVGAPYYTTLESGSLTPTGMAGWIMLVVASMIERTRRLRRPKDPMMGLLILFFLWTCFSFLVTLLTGLDMLPAVKSNFKTYYLLSFIVVGLLLAEGKADSFSWFLQGVKWVSLLACLAIWYLYFTSGVFTTWDLWTGRRLGRTFMPGLGNPSVGTFGFGSGSQPVRFSTISDVAAQTP